MRVFAFVMNKHQKHLLYACVEVHYALVFACKFSPMCALCNNCLDYIRVHYVQVLHYPLFFIDGAEGSWIRVGDRCVCLFLSNGDWGKLCHLRTVLFGVEKHLQGEQ